MCPFDMTMSKALTYLDMFLPTYNSFSVRNKTFDLWFEELMAFWEACPNLPVMNVFSIFSRLAAHTSGYLDWAKYIPMFLTKITSAFNLPVIYKNVAIPKRPIVDINTSVKWIVAVMNKNPEMFDCLEQMFTALDSYYHTANIKLHQFLYKLVKDFVAKIHRERYRKKIVWGCTVPPENKITDEQITRFVKMLMPVVLNGMYNKTGSYIFANVLQHLAFLRPELAIPPVMEKLFVAFETLTEPHKLTASMHSVYSMARSIVHPSSK